MARSEQYYRDRAAWEAKNLAANPPKFKRDGTVCTCPCHREGGNHMTPCCKPLDIWNSVG